MSALRVVAVGDFPLITGFALAGVSVIAAMGIITYLIFVMIERRFTGWAMRKHNNPVVVGGG